MTCHTTGRSLLVATFALAGASLAIPLPPLIPAAGAASLHPVAMGCGIGRSRDAFGRCRHSFNLFDRRDRHHFRRFRQNHCDRMETPNGAVHRCRI